MVEARARGEVILCAGSIGSVQVLHRSGIGPADWLTPLGIDALARSAAIFDDLRAQWAARLGPQRLAALEADLRTMVPRGSFRLDVPGWFGA